MPNHVMRNHVTPRVYVIIAAYYGLVLLDHYRFRVIRLGEHSSNALYDESSHSGVMSKL